MFNDINRDNYLKKRIYINRLNQYNAQNFLTTDTIGNVVFKNYFNIGDVIELKKNETNQNILI